MAKAVLTTTLAHASAFNDDGDILWDGDHLAYILAVQSYRSLRRFITRHVAPHADSRIRRLLGVSAEARARILDHDSRARDTWAVAIWSSDLERKAFYRLWADRSDPLSCHRIQRVVLSQDAMGMELTIKAPDGPIRAAQGDWLLRHAALATLRHRFARARALAQGMADAGDAELGEGMLGSNRLTLTGELLDGGDLQFAVDAEPMQDVLVPRPHRTKAQRRDETADLHRQGLQELKRLCNGPCLRFSWRDGWGAASSTVPDLAAGVTVKRNRLFAEGRPCFIIFSTPVGWCARMVDMPLEVHDDEPWKVIDTLRHAYTRYKKQQESRAPTPMETAASVHSTKSAPPHSAVTAVVMHGPGRLVTAPHSGVLRQPFGETTRFVSYNGKG